MNVIIVPHRKDLFLGGNRQIYAKHFASIVKTITIVGVCSSKGIPVSEKVVFHDLQRY